MVATQATARRDADREAAARAARAAAGAGRDALIAALAAERGKAERAARRCAALENDAAARRRRPAPPPGPPPELTVGGAPTTPMTPGPPSPTCPHTGLSPKVAREPVEDLFAAAAADVVEGRRSRRPSSSGGRGVDAARGARESPGGADPEAVRDALSRMAAV